MNSTLKTIVLIITPVIIIDTLRSILQKLLSKRDLERWEQNGRPVPPPHIVKQKVIKEFQEEFKINILIETGTYKGDMVYAMKNNFKKIYSIELGVDLWKQACKRFKNQKHITILQGDSGKVLVELVSQINERALFWLDGHYSSGITSRGEKECPVFEELGSILNAKFNHVLLIDDARCFNGSGDYPTVEKLRETILMKKPLSKLDVKDDIIRIILA
jgi:hypothetical protein